MVQAAVILARIHQMQQSPHDHDSIRVRGSTTSERNDNDDDVDECFGEREREQAPLATTTTMMSNNRDDDDDNEHGLQLANLADEDRDATPALATHVSFDSLSSSEHQDENAAVVLQQQQCAPHPNDVLIGHADWPGTIRYHRWIRERKYDFHLAHTKQMRACLAKQVTVLVTARQSPPGRFLYFTLATKIWLPMDHTAVLTEIGKDFRLEAFSTVHVTATACSSPPPPPPRSLVQSSMGPPPTRTAPRYSLPPLPATATALAQRGPPFPRSGNLHPPLLGRMSTPVVPYPGSSTMRGGRDIRLAPPPPPPSFATPRSRHHHHQHRLVGLPLSMAMSQTKHGLHHTHTMPHTTVSEAPPRGHHLLLADKPASVRRSISNDITGDKTMTFADGSVFLPAASRPAPVVRHGSADEYRFVSGSDTTASWDGSMSMYHPNQQQQPLKKARKPHTFWIQEEDERLRHAVAVHGLGKWGVVAQGVTNRTAEQCRYRWTHCVNPDINRAPLTVEECRMILKQHAFHGNKWTKIAKALPGRYVRLHGVYIYIHTYIGQLAFTSSLTLSFSHARYCYTTSFYQPQHGPLYQKVLDPVDPSQGHSLLDACS